LRLTGRAFQPVCGNAQRTLSGVTNQAPTSSVPLVGVTTYYSEAAAWGPWHDRPASVVPAPYFELVAAAGCRPMLLPPCHDDGDGGAAGAAEAVGALDALVLVGGGDLDPAGFGGGDHETLSGVDPVRDRAERALLEAALEADVPVLAICRGLQLLNVALGGSLTLHLPERVGHHGHQPAPGQFSEVEVATVPGSAVAKELGERLTVQCSHHQAIDRLGAGLVVTARSVEPDGSDEPGGVVEAVELPGRQFVVGVQWHPEEAGDRRLFEALARAAQPALVR
jgi:gamma-glutamyl-gamma-aminobutyrate hydrolase PuuD